MSESDPNARAPETVTFPPAPAATADFTPSGGSGLVIAGKYTLLEPIGEGGMGEVWVAKQTHPVQRKVALKLIKAGMDSKQVLARFEAERQALALMDHPNIAKVLDGGIVEAHGHPSVGIGRPFFVMELVNGLPLTRYCDEAKLTPRERLRLFVPVCQAVQHAHQKGIVHRDLKPTNILVTLYDGKPVPKVIDFGVAKATGGRLTDQTLSTQFGAVVGTFEYMAPEQAGFSALDVDTRADIYSLGVILYELLTGLRPFEGSRLRKAALDELFRILREEDPPRPSTKLSTDASLPDAAAVRRTDPRRLAALLRGELDWIVMKCLEKDRTRRYESASALARDVERYLADEPVEARSPTLGYRTRKFLRRNRSVAVTLGGVFLTLCVAVAATGLGLLEARRQRDAAERAQQQADADRTWAVAEFQRAEQEAGRARQAEFAQAEARRQAEAALLRSDGLRLGSLASIARSTDPGLSLLLGLEAVRRYPHHLTYTALYDAAADLRERRSIPAGVFYVKGAHVSPDGTRALTFTNSGGDATARLVDLPSGQALAGWRGFRAGATTLDWSPDGARAVATTEGRVTVAFTDGQKPERATFTERVAYVWDTTTGRDLVHLRGHTDKVISARFSPDGTKILTASWDGSARLWDAVSGKELHVLAGHHNSLLTALFSPDGKRVLTVSAQYTQSAHYRDYDGKPRPLPDPNVDPGPTTRPWQPSGSGSGSSGGITRQYDRPVARLWDAETGKELGGLGYPDDRDIRYEYGRERPDQVAFSPDGRRVAIAFHGEVMRVWDVQTRQEPMTLTGHRGTIQVLSFSPHASDLVSAGDGGEVILWDLTTGKLARRFEGHANQPIHVARFSIDGRRLVTAGADRTARVWQVNTGKELAVFRGHSGWVVDAHFLPDGESVLTAGDSSLRVWSIPPPAPVPVPLRDPDPPSGRLGRLFGRAPARHNGSVTVLTFTPDGRSALTGSSDNTVRQWDPATGRQTVEVVTRLRGDVRSIQIGPGGVVYVATTVNDIFSSDAIGSEDVVLSQVHRWDPATGRAERFLKKQSAGISHMALSPDGRRLLLQADEHGIKFGTGRFGRFDYAPNHDRAGQATVWDVETGNLVCTLPPGKNTQNVMPARFSPDGTTILYPTEQWDQLALYDSRTGKPVRMLASPKLRGGYEHWAEAAFSPDGRLVVGQRRGEREIWFWDAATGERLGSFVNTLQVASLAPNLKFSPDSKSLAFASDQHVQLVDVATRTAGPLLRGHASAVQALAFSPDGSRVLTGSEDKTAAVWETATGRLLTVYRGHAGGVNQVAFSPDGTRVATASTSEPLARVWPVNLIPEFERRKSRELSAWERAQYELPAAGK